MTEETKKQNVGILNWWWNSNRGAILTCYAIYELVKEFGHNPLVIKHIPYDYYNTEYLNSISEKFAEKYLKTTKWCHSRIDMRTLNDELDTFMVGSDQVWRHSLNWFLQDFYYLNFVELNKKKISCAASFGIPDFTGNNTLISMVKYYFSRFDHISVREKEAVSLLKETFDTSGTFILDPVFLINKNKYIEIANNCNIKVNDDFIAYYFIHPSDKKEKILQDMCKELNVKAINLKKSGLDVEEWLYYLKNSKIVLSDSFHASSFSIIFNKKFLTLFDYSKDSRYATLENITGLNYRFVKSSEFNQEIFNRIMQEDAWTEIEQKLQPLKDFSVNWLRNAINDNSKRQITKEQEFLESFYASMDDRLNYLECKTTEINLINQRVEKLELQNDKNLILRNYYKYKILSVLTKKEKYKTQAHLYHEKVRKLRAK